MARSDPRRWIYGGLDIVFAVILAIVLWKVAANRVASARIHLWTFPVFLLAMAAGTMVGGKRGRLVALVSGSLLLASTMLAIIRLLTSAAFLAGVYGAFGQAAAMSALVAVALIIELVALLPIVQVKYLMSRAGRRAYQADQP